MLFFGIQSITSCVTLKEEVSAAKGPGIAESLYTFHDRMQVTVSSIPHVCCLVLSISFCQLKQSIALLKGMDCILPIHTFLSCFQKTKFHLFSVSHWFYMSLCMHISAQSLGSHDYHGFCYFTNSFFICHTRMVIQHFLLQDLKDTITQKICLGMHLVKLTKRCDCQCMCETIVPVF